MFNSTLRKSEFEMDGEGSGTFKSWKESTGELEAVLVWEGGDSTRIKVKDGEISELEVL